MAKNMAKNKTHAFNELPKPTIDENAVQPTDGKGDKTQKAVVSVDSKKAEPKKNKKTKKASDKPNIFKRMWKGIKGIFSELKKVTWPKGKDVMKATTVVIIVVFAFFLILFGIDYVLAGILGLIVNGTWTTLFI
ncbi:MAG: preprotein translocase subunit SecE [Clostridia bacterium]